MNIGDLSGLAISRVQRNASYRMILLPLCYLEKASQGVALIVLNQTIDLAARWSKSGARKNHYLQLWRPAT
jgi:hypothetical protein